jgi:hypothetical protein
MAATLSLEISVAGLTPRHIEPVRLKAPCVSTRVAGRVKPAATDANHYYTPSTFIRDFGKPMETWFRNIVPNSGIT